MNNSQKGKFDVNELITKASDGKADEKSVNDFINKNLTDSQARAVRDLLSDPEKTKAVLNSDAAKMIFKKFFGGRFFFDHAFVDK